MRKLPRCQVFARLSRTRSAGRPANLGALKPFPSSSTGWRSESQWRHMESRLITSVHRCSSSKLCVILSMVGHLVSPTNPPLANIDIAHANLYEINLLHRDISNKNILLGREEAPDGFKGILIDLSVALDFGPNANPTVTKEARPVRPPLASRGHISPPTNIHLPRVRASFSRASSSDS